MREGSDSGAPAGEPVRLASPVGPFPGRSRNANASGLDDDEGSHNTIPEVSDDIDHRLAERASRSRRETNQEHASAVASMAERKLAEVFVFGQHYPYFGACSRENHIILSTWTEFNDCGYVMAGAAQSPDDGKVAALVGKELHRLVSTGVLADEDDFFMSDSVSGVAHRRLNILTGEPRMCIQKVGLGSALAQFAQNQFHRDSGSPNDGLPHHHARIHFDAFRECHRRPRGTVLARIIGASTPAAGAAR
jgi:hypothetical protein